MSSGVNSPWWERDPERLESELAQIAEITPVLDRREDDGSLVLEICLPFRADQVPVTVTFRPGHPFLPPILAAPPGTVERHQSPNDGHFCLMDNEDHEWKPSWMAATLVEELQRLFLAFEEGTVHEGELAIPEPVSGYVPESSIVVLVHGQMLGDRLISADGEFVLSEYRPERFVVDSITGVRPTSESLPEDLSRRVHGQQSGRQQSGRWSLVDPPPRPSDLNRLMEAAVQELAEVAEPKRRRAGRGRRNPAGTELWTARTFMEEGPRRGELRRTWIFYRVILDREGSLGSLDIVGTQALSEAKRGDRLKELSGLRDSAFLLVGAGALGAPVAGELAKSGSVELDIVDPGHYDVNNSVRHVLPFSFAGAPKATSVAAWAEGFNPYSNCRGHQFGVGRSDPDQLARLVAGANVVIDATGLHVVTRYLHEVCAAHGKPLVSGALSLGGFGGRVVRINGRSPCFDCFLADAAIPMPLESSREDEMHTPYGCSHPAASCSGFDVSELAANIARTAVRASELTEYPALDFDWAVVNFRPGADRWTQGKLVAGGDCQWCVK